MQLICLLINYYSRKKDEEKLYATLKCKNKNEVQYIMQKLHLTVNNFDL